MNFYPTNPQSEPYTVNKFLQGPGKVLAIEPTIDTEEFGTYRMITNNKDHDTRFIKLRDLQTYLMKEKEKNQTMISSLRIFGKYIEVIGSQPTSIPTNNLVKQLESQVKNQMTPSQPKK